MMPREYSETEHKMSFLIQAPIGFKIEVDAQNPRYLENLRIRIEEKR